MSIMSCLRIISELRCQAPVGYFDPMGMSKDGDMKTFRRRRESELKNGRVAMFATMGCILATLAVDFNHRI